MWYFAYCIFQLGDCLFKLRGLGEASEVNSNLYFSKVHSTLSHQTGQEAWGSHSFSFCSLN